MPNVTFYISQGNMPADEALVALTECCAGLCTTILQAAPKNVHIVHIAVRPGRGHPVFVEIRYRREPHRTAAVMDRFMKELEDAVRGSIGLAARIRCFDYDASNIYARN